MLKKSVSLDVEEEDTFANASSFVQLQQGGGKGLLGVIARFFLFLLKLYIFVFFHSLAKGVSL